MTDPPHLQPPHARVKEGKEGATRGVAQEIKRLKDLEREKDSLWAGLQVLEQARLWYRHKLEDNRARQANVGTRAGARAKEWGGEGASSCLLRSQIQRVNGSLGRLMSEPNVTSCPSSPKRDGVEVSDSELRWQNTVLVQEVSEKNLQISLLELERDSLLQELSVHLLNLTFQTVMSMPSGPL
ncbi:hypothetical protein J4Q44_G00144890 [Coregonus suidteri]|uniref:Uncharacterized protein n=1 Tax=Coregonus suidteri TaxID=861788 RepID=A0AAN8QSU2_9TELE